MQTVIYVISTTFLPLKRRRLSRETYPAARSEQRRHHKQCNNYFHISLHFTSLEPYSRLWTDLWTTFHILWLAIGLLPNLTPTPLPRLPPPPPGKTLVIREPYQSPEHAFDSFLKDDLPDQNKNVEKCKQQSKDFKSSSSLWKKDSTLSFVYIALSLSLQGLHGSKVFTRGYTGS